MLPEYVELVAEEIGTGDDAAAEAVGEALNYYEVDYDGFVAIDVHFEDETGTEVEPDGAVAVSFSLPEGMLPEGVEGVSVQHLVEDEDGNVEAVETVAVETETEEEGSISVEDGVVLIEFEVESFSTFTITSSNGYPDFPYDIVLQYTDGTEVTLDDDYTVSVSNSNTNFTTIVPTISDGTYNSSSIVFVDTDGTTYTYTNVKQIKRDSSGWNFNCESVSAVDNSGTAVTVSSTKLIINDSNSSSSYYKDTSTISLTLYITYLKAATDITVYTCVTENSTTTISTETLSLADDTAYAVSDIAPTVTGSTTLTYVNTILAETGLTTEPTSTSGTVVTGVKYDSSADAWYYTTSTSPSSTTSWTAIPDGYSLYFIYRTATTISAVLTYKAASDYVDGATNQHTSPTDNTTISITLGQDAAYQINKMSFASYSSISDTYFYGKGFSYAVVCGTNDDPFSATAKTTWIRYDSSSGTLQYTESSDSSNLTWVDFDNSSQTLYFLYYATTIQPGLMVDETATTDGTQVLSGTTTTISLSQDRIELQADNGYTASDLKNYAATITGYTLTNLVVWDGINSPVTVYRVMWASNYSEHITNNGSSVAGWYYRVSDSDSWVQFDSVSYLYFSYSKNDITVVYNNDTTGLSSAPSEASDGTDTGYTYPDGVTLPSSFTITDGVTTGTDLSTPSGLSSDLTGTRTVSGVTYLYTWTGWVLATDFGYIYYNTSLDVIAVSTYASGTTQTIQVDETAVVSDGTDTINLYATYAIEPVYAVTFAWGTDAPSSVTLPTTPQTFSGTGTVTLPTYSTVTEDNVIYTWNGWYLDADKDGVIDDDETTTVYAASTDETYTVSTDLQFLGSWTLTDVVALELYTNFELSGDEETYIKAFFDDDYADHVSGYTSDGNAVSGTVASDAKSITDSEIGTITVGDTIELEEISQGTEITIESNSYLFSGWKISVTVGSTTTTFDVGSYVNKNSSSLPDSSSKYTDSTTGIVFWVDNGSYYITVPAGTITVQASLFKETKTWTAHEDGTSTGTEVLTVSRDSVDFSSTSASLGTVKIIVYVWSPTAVDYVEAERIENFYFSYSTYACVDLTATLSTGTGYGIVGIGYMVCYASAGATGAKWEDNSNPGSGYFILDNATTNTTVSIYLAKTYTVQYELYYGSANDSNSTLIASTSYSTYLTSYDQMTDTNAYSPVGVDTSGVTACTETSSGHTSQKNSTTCATGDQVATVVEAFTLANSSTYNKYTLYTENITVATVTAAFGYTIDSWYLVDNSGSTSVLTTTTYSQGASLAVTTTALLEAADPNNVITLRAYLTNSAAPSGIHRDTRPYILLIFLVLPMGILFLYMKLMRRQKKYMELKGNHASLNEIRKDGSNRMRVIPRKEWFDG